jgi:hypothetical protein
VWYMDLVFIYYSITLIVAIDTSETSKCQKLDRCPSMFSVLTSCVGVIAAPSSLECGEANPNSVSLRTIMRHR